MMENDALRDKIRKMKLARVVRKVAAGVVTMFTMAVNAPVFASARSVNDDKNEPGKELFIKNSEDNVKFEAKMAVSNFSAMGVDKDGCYFYNDLVPNANISVEKNDWYGTFNATELLMLNANDKGNNFTPINAKFALELGKEISHRNGDESGKFSLILGRDNVMAGDQLFNGVDINEMSIENRYMVLFGNGTDRMVLSYKDSKGTKVELGAICNKGDGWLVIPNPKEADLWAKVGVNVLDNHKDLDLKVALAGRIGQKDEVHGNIAFSDSRNEYGISVGGKYDINKQQMAAFVAFNKDFCNGCNVIFHSSYNQNEIVLTGSVGKDGLNIFTEVDFNTNSTVNDHVVNNARVGVSYSFGKTMNLGRK